jgi:hypothetical protein
MPYAVEKHNLTFGPPSPGALTIPFLSSSCHLGVTVSVAGPPSREPEGLGFTSPQAPPLSP